MSNSFKANFVPKCLLNGVKHTNEYWEMVNFFADAANEGSFPLFINTNERIKETPLEIVDLYKHPCIGSTTLSPFRDKRRWLFFTDADFLGKWSPEIPHVFKFILNINKKNTACYIVLDPEGLDEFIAQFTGLVNKVVSEDRILFD